MQNNKDLFEKIISKHRLVFIIILLITIPLGYQFSKQEFCNDVDIFFEPGDKNLIRYKEFQKSYGNEEIVLIAFKDENIFSHEKIELIRKISESMKNINGVQRVLSLTETEEAAGEGNTVRFEKIIPANLSKIHDMKAIKARILKNEFIKDRLLSSDAKSTAILVEIKPLTEAVKNETIKEIKDMAGNIAGGAVKLYIAGGPVFETEMNRLTVKDFFTFLPLTLLIIAIIVTITLKNFILSAICQVNMFLTVMWTIGIYVLMGEKFNIVTSIMGATILAITIEDSIHVLTEFREEMLENNIDHRKAMISTLKRVWFPCFLTSVTTAIGFIFFVTAGIRPTKIVGIYSSIGVVIGYILTMTFIPASIYFLRNRIHVSTAGLLDHKKIAPGHEDRFMTILLKITDYVTNRYHFLNLLLIIITVVSVVGMFKIKVETNSLNYLSESHQLRKNMSFIEEKIGGTLSIELLLHAKSKDHDFTHPESLRMLEEIQNDIMKNFPNVTSSMSVANYLKDVNRAFNKNDERFYTIPQTSGDIIDYMELDGTGTVDMFTAKKNMEVRMSLQTKWGSNDQTTSLLNSIAERTRPKLGNNYTMQFTGLGTLYVEMENILVDSQISSFIPALIAIFFMMFFIARSFSLTMISIIPNIFPIYVILGVMGWFKIPLDVSTMMIANVTIGIAIDDTVHIITWFRRNMSSTHDYKDALMKTIKDCGKPISITSFVLFLGFLVLVLGNIVPTRTFGALTALSMIIAVLGEIYTPTLIMQFKPKIKKSVKSLLDSL